MLTAAEIASTQNDEELFQALGRDLERRLPNGRRAEDSFVAELDQLPVGLRAMAATYDLDVSLTLDDFGWHFGSWHHVGLAQATLSGLEELGAGQLASLFQEALACAEVYWAQLGSAGWTDWYHGSPLEQRMAPLNDAAWALMKREQGVLTYWVPYARRFPDRVS